ncbi:MAG: hypothetical protein ABSB76_25260 [Streptosporangiaceae bacterium]|jgi:hypothetical protein
MVIAEAACLIGRQLGAKAEASLYASIIDGQLEVADLGIADWQRIQDLMLRRSSCCHSTAAAPDDLCQQRPVPPLNPQSASNA